MRKFMLAGIAAATALLLSVSMSTIASAAPTKATHDVLTWGRAGGANVAKGQTLTANLARGAKGVFASSAGTITCTKSSFTAKVTSNPRRPGTATESLTKQTFSSCHATGNPDITGVKSVVITGLPYKTTISDKRGDPVTVSKSATTLNLDSTIGVITCKYHATVTRGNASNKTQTISFTSQKFTKVSGPSVCSGTGKFSASYGPVIDASVRHHPHVFVN